MVWFGLVWLVLARFISTDYQVFNVFMVDLEKRYMAG